MCDFIQSRNGYNQRFIIDPPKRLLLSIGLGEYG